jgi:hypothetical protein
MNGWVGCLGAFVSGYAKSVRPLYVHLDARTGSNVAGVAANAVPAHLVSAPASSDAIND